MAGKKFGHLEFSDISQKEYTTRNFKGFYIVNYWFEGCPLCRKEKKWLEKFSFHKPEVQVISFCRDSYLAFQEYPFAVENWICVPDYED